MLLCAQYVIPITDDPIENGAVLVRDGKIEDIGKAEFMTLRYPNEEMRDFGMAAITPGFINLYGCSEDAVLRGLVPDVPYMDWLTEIWKLRSKLTKDERYISSYLGGLEAISSGITTVSDITHSGESVHAMNELGLRGMFYREVHAVDKDLVDYSVKKADTDLKRWSSEVDQSRIHLGLAPSQVFRCHPSLYTAVTNYANGHDDTPVALRLAGSREEYQFVKYGSSMGTYEHREALPSKGYMEVAPWLPTSVTPVNYVLNWGGLNAKNVLAIHCVRVNDDDIEKLKENNVAVAVCPTINAQLGMGAAPVMEFLRAGLRVGIASNAPAALDFVDIFTEMRVALLIQRAMNAGSRDFLSSQTMLEMGTIRAAEALGLQDEVGSLEVGKKADIVAIDLSGSHQVPTDNPQTAVLSSASSGDVMMTMVDGAILYERGHWRVGGEVAKNIAKVLEVRGRLRSDKE